ncbi:urease accessory protein UreD [Streptomyces rapamycinicus]|nr:urease accessory protein UreD [Streptomyces rapamycinicus]MBB4780653.1 urease accessory protein [Streptomyces rapamycinicus]UTO61363.1 urease accessory protein UreD [Streptomyces rapamycinicus]UTP29310.1 urease accessory protein UreD [Streptomyces rapamycinicus NRRL 5491]
MTAASATTAASGAAGTSATTCASGATRVSGAAAAASGAAGTSPTTGISGPVVRATARLVAEADGRGGTALPVLAGDGPLALRRTRGVGGEACVTVVGAMSAPLGGDRIALEATAGPGARLRIGSAAATIALPGRAAGPAYYEIRLTVADGATLHWLPEPLISAHGSELLMTTRVELAPTARLVLREEQILGRTGESPGHLTSRLTVHRAGRPLLDQEFAHGPGAPGWDGGAVLGGHRAVGQLLVVDPAYDARPIVSRRLAESAVLTPLTGPAALATAVAPDALHLRRALDAAVAAVG